jgi:DNA polymerase epsilon subunit 1
MRVAIDLEIRVGAWFSVKPLENGMQVERLNEMLDKAEPRILAFDIECTKAPLKFPVAEVDEIFMISYMTGPGEGYLITSREHVSQDIEDFEYTPKASYPGYFTIFNEKDEEALIRKFFDHCKQFKPQIYVTYNGDFFDWPFLETRALKHGMNMEEEIGIRGNKAGEYFGRCSTHMDCFYWVKRDSYLPQGSQGLKAVTKYKLGYDPVEVDPEDMVRYARERPQHMASYSVSDAVATWYLYEKYVHLFVYSLCTIIPLPADDVLRKGSGTLCESLLMVEAFRGNIVCPNKSNNENDNFYEGHLLETETYIGGHVECLETGVYRSDIPVKFKMVPQAFDNLIRDIDRALTFSLEVEHGVQRSDIGNYDDVRADIVGKLEMLRDTPTREEEPLIYHLDVAAMYPNIILTNRLQPVAIVSESTCASCDFNREENNCQRRMEWVWRGEYYPASKSEFKMLKMQLEVEAVEVDGYEGEKVKKPFYDCTKQEQSEILRKRMKGYCQRVYKKVKVTKETVKTDTTCMRENPFYVNTVRNFRDRRYEYKLLTKVWKKRAGDAKKSGDAAAEVHAGNMALVYDSLQTAHKCILNSFYGYVMRKGARWYSMEMAGIVTYTGANLITQARILVEQVGRPLELDTDGIWCLLPASFPKNYAFKGNDGKKFVIEYPTTMLNADVHENYTNHQYQDLVDKSSRSYNTRSECSIYFELDGPYRCMVLPSSTEEGRLLKKRYAVFNFDGTLAELKGFEIKRRGELNLIKHFQQGVFEQFLNGNNLEECYAAVATSANFWIDVLDSKGADMDTDELVDLISENRSMSKSLAEYGEGKSTSINTARRLGEFLGGDMVKDKGLACKMVISKFPAGIPVSERSIPTAIWKAEPAVMKHFLRKWCGDSNMQDFDIRAILDWDYYRGRLGTSIQKIITIPAALQKVDNPVPRIPHPDWLARIVREKNDKFQQKAITSMFAPISAEEAQKRKNKEANFDVDDIEDMMVESKAPSVGKARVSISKNRVSDDSGAIAAARSGSHELSKTPVSLADGNVDEWVQDRKARWKRDRAERKKMLKEAGNMGGDAGMLQRGSKNASGVSQFLQSAANSVAQNHWQIVEIREMDQPGQFQVWAMTGQGQLQAIPIEIPRIFHINCYKPLPAETLKSRNGRSVARELPRGKRPMHLYEIKLSESQFMRNEKELASFIAHPDVHGVYELQMPLIQRALIALGCAARVRKGYGAIDTTRALPIENLEFLTATSHPYLETASATFRRKYIYHSQQDQRGIVAIFHLSESNSELAEIRGDNADLTNALPVTATAQVWIVNPFKKGGNPPNVSSIYQTFKEHEDSSCTFAKTSTVATMEQAMAELSALLRTYVAERNGPTIITTQSPFAGATLLQKIPALRELPMVRMQGNDDDSSYPALGWQSFATQRMVQRFNLFDRWWEDRLRCSRYAHLPIGNMSDDFAVDTADIFFSRRLQHNKYLLWMSNSSKPDLGGDDDNDMWVEEHENPRICVPGAYRTLCIDIDIHGLAVNTILASADIQDLEGADGAISLDVIQGGSGMQTELDQDFAKSNFSPLDDIAACAGPFRILKTLITDWYSDVTKTGNPYADSLLVHFYRWICAPTSKLHEPGLHRAIHRMMKKVFLQLMAEFESLGAKVVFATFNKVIINTNKTTRAAAEAYYKYIEATIKSKSLFACLQLNAKEYWEQLLFQDNQNFGGVVLDAPVPAPAQAESDEDNDEDGVNAEEVPSGDDQEPGKEISSRTRSSGSAPSEPEQPSAEEGPTMSIVSHWNICDYLPESIQEYFQILVGEFIFKPVKYRQRVEIKHNIAVAQLQHAGGSMEDAADGESKGIKPGQTGYVEQQCEQYTKDLVGTYLLPKLLELVPDIQTLQMGPVSYCSAQIQACTETN